MKIHSVYIEPTQCFPLCWTVYINISSSGHKGDDTDSRCPMRSYLLLCVWPAVWDGSDESRDQEVRWDWEGGRALDYKACKQC